MTGVESVHPMEKDVTLLYLYQPCLLTLFLYAWAFEETRSRRHWLRILFPLAVLLLSGWELQFTRISIYPAAMLLPVRYAVRKVPAAAWTEVLCAAILGGLLCWKAADAWPLLPGLGVLCGALMMIPVCLLCRGREDRFLACALGGLCFELFFCIKEYLLFSYAIVRLGSREGLSVASAALCCLGLLEQGRQTLISMRKRSFSMRI